MLRDNNLRAALMCSACVVLVLCSTAVSGRSVFRQLDKRTTSAGVTRSIDNLLGEGDDNSTTYVVTATQLPVTATDCETPADFQRRLAVFYGIPWTRVHVINTSTACRIQFMFVNNTADDDYYSNRQLTALLLSLNETYVEQYLLVASLAVSNGTSPATTVSPPTISPIPRAPTEAEAAQSPVKHFVATLSSRVGCIAFQNQQLSTFLSIPPYRVDWSQDGCFAVGATQQQSAAASSYSIHFSIADTSSVAAAPKSDQEQQQPSSYALPPVEPLRNDIENALIDGGILSPLSPLVGPAIGLESLVYTIVGETTVVQVSAISYTSPPVVAVGGGGVGSATSIFTFASKLVNAFSPAGPVSNSTFYPLYVVGATASSGIVIAGQGQVWTELSACLATHVTTTSAPPPAKGDGDGPLYTILGIVFIFTGAAAGAVAFMRRRSYHTLGLEGDYVLTNTNEMSGGPAVTGVVAMEAPQSLATASGGDAGKASASDRTTLLSSAM